MVVTTGDTSKMTVADVLPRLLREQNGRLKECFDNYVLALFPQQVYLRIQDGRIEWFFLPAEEYTHQFGWGPLGDFRLQMLREWLFRTYGLMCSNLGDLADALSVVAQGGTHAR